MPAEILRCPADPRDYTPTEETFYQPFYPSGESYAGPYNHRYSYGAIMSAWNRGDRRMPWSLPVGVSSQTGPHEGALGNEQIPDPTILQLVWDAHIPIFSGHRGLSAITIPDWEIWDSEGLGMAPVTVFRHAQNDWVDWSQGPNNLRADGHVEQWLNWHEVLDHHPESEDWFSIPWP